MATLSSDARSEAERRYPENHLVPDPFGETGEAWTDPYGYNEDARKSFIAGAEWQASRTDTTPLIAEIGSLTSRLQAAQATIASALADPLGLEANRIPLSRADTTALDAAILTAKAEQAEHDSAIVRGEIREPRPHQEITRSINECDIIVNAALGKSAAKIRAQSANPVEAIAADKFNTELRAFTTTEAERDDIQEAALMVGKLGLTSKDIEPMARNYYTGGIRLHQIADTLSRYADELTPGAHA